MSCGHALSAVNKATLELRKSMPIHTSWHPFFLAVSDDVVWDNSEPIVIVRDYLIGSNTYPVKTTLKNWSTWPVLFSYKKVLERTFLWSGRPITYSQVRSIVCGFLLQFPLLRFLGVEVRYSLTQLRGKKRRALIYIVFLK